MTAKLIWNGTAAKANVRAKVAVRVKAATDTLFSALVKKMSKSSPPSSKPGEYPGKRTGRLVKTFRKEFSAKKLEGRVGSEDELARIMQLGSKNMRPRPWLSLIIAEMKTKLRGVVLSKGGK